MKDPYVLEDGTLKNLLGITDYKELKRAETDIGYVKIINASEVLREECDKNLLKAIHKHIFGDIFDWAGKFRSIPIYKREVVIPGVSLEYSKPEDIEKRLEEEIGILNSRTWKNKGIMEISQDFSRDLARIWRIHPFRDGNTRTVLTFATIFAKEHDFEMDMSEILNQLTRQVDSEGIIRNYSVRDRFVLAALDEKDSPEPQYLEWIIKRSIERGINNKIKLLKDLMER